MSRLCLTMMVALVSMPSHAHLVGPASSEFHWWHVDPVAVALLLVMGVAYAIGIRRQSRRSQSDAAAFKRRQWYFWAGWLTLGIALASPLDPLGEQLFAAHMLQHEVMMLITAPLLILSRPGAAMLRGVPRLVGRGAGALLRGHGLRWFWAWLATPLVAWLVHFAVLWGWHLPALFSAGLENTWVHALQHLSFFWVALLFWWALVRARQNGSAVGVLYLFTTAVHASVLGALLTFSPEVWYAPYLQTAPAWGLSALEDQQLGGLIMWVPSGLVYVVAALMEVASYMRNSARRAEQIDSARGAGHAQQ